MRGTGAAWGRGALGLALGVSGLGPLALLLAWSFAGRWYFPALLPTEWSARAWTSVFAPTSPVWRALAGSLTVAVAAALIGTALALPAARLLAHSGPRTRGPLTALLLGPLVLPGFAGVLGVQVVFVRLGLADTPAGVVLAHLIPVTPYAVALLTGVFEAHDARHEEVARTLGASRWRVLTRVTLPALRPGVLVAFALAFLVSWSEYLLTLVVGGGAVVTLPLLLFASAQGGDTALTAALALVYVAPTVALFTLTARFLRGWRP